jgi:hypothetical protein
MFTADARYRPDKNSGILDQSFKLRPFIYLLALQL